MRRLALLVVLVSMASQATAAELALWVDPDGTTYLYNATLVSQAFAGYQITGDDDPLNPLGWKSIDDYVAAGQSDAVIAALGAGALTFHEANPHSNNIAELSVPDLATLGPGAKWLIGKPFAVSVPAGVYPSDNQTWFVPEPASWALAVVALIGLAAARSR